MPHDVGTEIPVLTDALSSPSTALPPDERAALIAELQTMLASRTFALTERVLRAALAEIEATLFERVSTRLRHELPELIDATLRERLHAAGDND